MRSIERGTPPNNKKVKIFIEGEGKSDLLGNLRKARQVLVSVPGVISIVGQNCPFRSSSRLGKQEGEGIRLIERGVLELLYFSCAWSHGSCSLVIWACKGISLGLIELSKERNSD